MKTKENKKGDVKNDNDRNLVGYNCDIISHFDSFEE